MNMLLFDHVDGGSLFPLIVGIHLQEMTYKKKHEVWGVFRAEKFMQLDALQFMVFF
jgi:hypothetical protein